MADDLTKAKVRENLVRDYEYLDKLEDQKRRNIDNLGDRVEAEVIKRQKDVRGRALDQLDE